MTMTDLSGDFLESRFGHLERSICSLEESEGKLAIAVAELSANIKHFNDRAASFEKSRDGLIELNERTRSIEADLKEIRGRENAIIGFLAVSTITLTAAILPKYLPDAAKTHSHSNSHSGAIDISVFS